MAVFFLGGLLYVLEGERTGFVLGQIYASD